MEHEYSYRKRLTGYDVSRQHYTVRVKAATRDELLPETWGRTMMMSLLTVLGLVVAVLLA